LARDAAASEFELVDSSGRARAAALILRYARQHPPAEYADTYDVGAIDEQRLMLGTCPGNCRYGPRVVIAPRRNTHVVLGEARRDSGVIIARMINLGPESYPKFNLHGRDTVYWWIRISRRDTFSVFVSTAPGSRPRKSNLVIHRHSPAWGQSLARWLWRETDEEAWTTCDGSLCCQSNGTELRP
jgi:hypothetical protein